MLLGVPAHADVADRRRDQDALGVLQRAQHDLDGKRAAVLPPRDQLDARAYLLRQRLGRGSGAVRDQTLCEALGDDGLHLLADQLVPPVSELLFGLKVQQDDLPALVHDHHRVGGSLQEPPVLRRRLLALAEIVGDFREAAQGARSIAQRREGEACQEARAVLSDAHSLFLMPALRGRHAEDVRGPASRDVLGRKEPGEALTDDLVGPVPLDPFGAGVPAGDAPLRIHREDRVVPDAVEQQAISLLARPKLSLHVPAGTFQVRQMLFRLHVHVGAGLGAQQELPLFVLGDQAVTLALEVRGIARGLTRHEWASVCAGWRATPFPVRVP